MRDFSNRVCKTISLLIAVVVALAFGGCTMTADTTLGSNMMPEDQVMVMRHLKIQGNTVIRYSSDNGGHEDIKDESLNGKNFLETRLYRTDSLLSSNLGKGYIGVRRSDTLGVRTASFASTMLYMNAIDEENGFGYMPIFDTMKLVLTINDYGGDTLAPIRYKVFELIKPLKDNVLLYDAKREDTVAYINCDLRGMYDKTKPIFEFTFPKSELNEGPSTVIVPMENTQYSWDFARRLMLIPENYADANSGWDGYGRNNIEIYTSDKKWSETFYGLYIVPDLESTPKNSKGAMYALDLSASGLMLQGRSRNPKDPTMIKDTVGMFYYFVDTDSNYNSSVNKVEHDYTQGLTGDNSQLLKPEHMDYTKPREERGVTSNCYVEGMGGPATEIYFTDDMLDALLALETSEGNYSKVGINQCLMKIYIKGAFYDWDLTQSNSVVLTPRLYESFSRLGTYTNYNRLSPVIDYDYVYESNNDVDSSYKGYLDRSRACYIMNITAHIQRLFNYAKSVRQEDENGIRRYLFNENDTNYVAREIYIGTEATSPYKFSICELQGMDDNAENSENNAPIEMDLTYTLIR